MAWPLLGGGQAAFAHDSKLDFNKVCSAEALFAAWEKFRRSKRARADVLAFERHLEANIFELADELTHGSYRHGPYQPFTVWDPKQRQIHKALVRDRLVHQAVTSAIEPLFEKGFIYDSHSCRKGKGTHAALSRLRRFLYRASRNNTVNVYALKLDINKFFASVDHQILMELLTQKISNPEIVDLLAEIIASYSVSSSQGLPLGNLTSQLFANVYLHQLDWFVKNHLCERFYLRYCDDFVILSPDRRYLADLVSVIDQFLATRLKLTIHPAKVSLRGWHQGIDFVGYVLKPHCTVLRTKTRQRMLDRLNSDNLTSYLGLCSHADSYELQQDLVSRQWLNI